MKSSFLKVSKTIFWVFFLSAAFLPVQAQDIATVLFGKESKADYIGQYNYNGKRKNGFGIERQKHGAVYVGDFSEDRISGRGMLIANEKGISNVPGAVVYIGNWHNGKKNGKGTCYNITGDLVYEGRFENDKPTGVIKNSPTEPSLQRFSMTEFADGLYLGEIVNDIPDGFGLTVEDDGNIVYGIMRHGIRQGIGMIFYELDVWEVGKWTDGEFRSFNNSKIANANLETFQANNKAWKKEMRGMLFEAASNFAKAGVTATTIAHEIKKDNTPEGDYVSSDENPSQSSANSTSKKKGQSVSGRCKRCNGSGKCEAKGMSNRKSACFGSGLCGYCDGTGWIKAGADEAKCTACNGTGKCKSCKGTGICPSCHGKH